MIPPICWLKGNDNDNCHFRDKFKVLRDDDTNKFSESEQVALSETGKWGDYDPFFHAVCQPFGTILHTTCLPTLTLTHPWPHLILNPYLRGIGWRIGWNGMKFKDEVNLIHVLFLIKIDMLLGFVF